MSGSRSAIRAGCGVVAIAILPGVLCGVFWPGQLLMLAAFGWIGYLARVGPQMQPDWSAVGMGVGALLLFGVGLHWFLGWFYAATVAKKASSAGEPNVPVGDFKVWAVKWTAAIVVIVVMMFVAGISMVGIAHQVAWLANSKEPLVNDNRAYFRKLRENRNPEGKEAVPAEEEKVRRNTDL